MDNTTAAVTRSKWSSKTLVPAAALLLLAFISEGVRWARAPAAATSVLRVAPDATPGGAGGFRLKERSSSTIPMPPDVPAAHASALAAVPGGDLLAFWWAGQRESAPDVRMYLARWRDGRWGPARAIVDRKSLGDALHFGVRRIGNPSAWVAPDGRVHLYLVATGLGGWAASRVVHLVSTDSGENFTVQRVLPLTPLFNTSVLVRTNPVGMADGGWLLPAYFEIGNKYPLIVSFDRQGAPRKVQRIGASVTALQPTLLPVSGSEIRALMRDIGPQRRVQQAVSHDGGDTWEDAPASGIANRDNSVAALRLVGGGFVLLHNDSPGEGSPRQWLRLSTSSDGQRWVPGFDVKRGGTGDEFSYPSVQQVGNQLHVTYTLQRKAIAHHVYDIEPAEVRP
jgi:predicted neuraminidase